MGQKEVIIIEVKGVIGSIYFVGVFLSGLYGVLSVFKNLFKIDIIKWEN